MHTRADAILDYWFGGTDEYQKVFWFGGSDQTDREIRETFAVDVEMAQRGELDEWAKTPRGRLALILLLDQFSRNVYRGTPRAFEGDAKAKELTLDALDRGLDRGLSTYERMFLLMPLMHAEDRDAQKKCVEALRTLEREAPEDAREAMVESIQYALRHKEIVDRFGRFPHRNKALRRESTAEEVEFLKGPFSSF